MIEVVEVNFIKYKKFYALIYNGILLKEVNYFLMELSEHGGRRGRRLASGSLRQYAYVFKQLFDYFEKRNLAWNEIDKNDFSNLIEELDLNSRTARKRINYLSNLWVSFYTWCHLKKINVQLKVKLYKKSGCLYKDDEILAHAKSIKFFFTTHEFTFVIPDKRKIRHLSPKTVKKLLGELKKIDTVYYVVAYFMVTSGLRISGALQLKSNSFPHYLEVKHLEWLTYEYIPKGFLDSRDTISLNYSIKGWQHISKIFALLNNRRSEKYYDKHERWPEKFFLKKNGEELKDYDVWSRFREVSRKLEMKITTHMLRHTYAVLFVLCYSKKKKIEPTSKAFFWDIHKQLQKNLGHVQISTTMIYCEAAYDYVSIDILDGLSMVIASN